MPVVTAVPGRVASEKLLSSLGYFYKHSETFQHPLARYCCEFGSVWVPVWADVGAGEVSFSLVLDRM